MEQLIHIDQMWLLAINGAHAPWADTLFWWVSKSYVWIPLYALLIGLLIKQFGWKRGLIYTAALFVAAGLSDYISSGIIKHLVCRPRPTHEPAIMDMVHTVNGYFGGKYGFVSSHAANTMSVAVLFALIWQQKNNHGWWLLLYVVLNCYSRMYLGVHYPGDILGGLIVGGLVAWGVYAITQRLVKRYVAPSGADDAADGQSDGS